MYCAVLEARRRALPDYRPCEDALTRVGTEPAVTANPSILGRRSDVLSRRSSTVSATNASSLGSILPVISEQHVRQSGYDTLLLKVDALSSSENNAREIRDAIIAMPSDVGAPRLVLVGYSKGAPDILEAVVAYPEVRSRVAAVVSVAGAVGGSPLASDADGTRPTYYGSFPGATCGPGDGGGVASLRPATRQQWLARNPLPSGLHYYSLVTFPRPELISSILASATKS